MRLLVLGGTRFLGKAVAADAVARGHHVTCAARGESGPVPEGATLVRVDRDADDGLAPLAGSTFDAVVDVATISYPWVAAALKALAADVGHWTFVSSINVYANTATPSQGTDAELLAPLRESGGEIVDPDAYGAIKVASEDALREAMGERAFIVRSGLITGPGDRGDRFGYWAARFVRGGRVVVPDVPDQPFQHVDVRDLASWIVDAGESGTGGTFDGIGPATPLNELLREIADATGGDAELVPVGPETLVAAGVTPWAGPKSLPLWAPSTHYGFLSHDAAPAIRAGLHIRPLAETVAGALATERELGLDRERKAGLTEQEEREILDALGGA